MKNKLSTSLSGINGLVCGSTSGIGKATAQEFALLGCSITLFARNEEKLNTTISSLQSSTGQQHQYLIGDFDDPDSINKIIEDHIASGNQYHILVNNSGGPRGGFIVDADTSELIAGFNRHLPAVIFLLRLYYQT